MGPLRTAITACLFLLVSADAWADRFSLGVGGSWSQLSFSNPAPGGSSVFSGPGAELSGRFELGKPKGTGPVDGVGAFGSWIRSRETNAAAAGETLTSSAYGVGADVRIRWVTLGVEWRSLSMTAKSSDGRVLQASASGFGPRAGLMLRLGKRLTLSPYFTLHELTSGASQSFSGEAQQISGWRAGALIYIRLVGSSPTGDD